MVNKFKPLKTNHYELFDHTGLSRSDYSDPAEGGHHIFLALLCAVYLGTVHMKALASCFVQWPGTDSDVGRIIKQYCTWQTTQHSSANAPTIPESETKSLGNNPY